VHELLDLQNLDISQQESTWVIEQLQVFDKELEGLVQSVLFDMEIDSSDCWIELACGSGGDDAMSFTQLLAQMYTKWGGREGFQVILEDVSHGDLAGFRKARLSVVGENAYGWLAGETGIHRLIRNSPFNKTNTRETSFARVDCVPKLQPMSVVPEGFDSSDVEISTFKSGGAGGQHANTTDSAVRVVHHPTGIVVKCSKERSQHANKKRCLSILRGKLHKLHEMAESVTQQEKYRAYEDNSFGSHFRSYHLVTGILKDTRSSFEGSNALRVLTEGIGLQEILVSGLHARKGV
jgi:peptide chain release factor 2